MNNAALLLEMRKKKTSHVLHLILSILTAGVWLFVWWICALSNAWENHKLDKQINKILATADK